MLALENVNTSPRQKASLQTKPFGHLHPMGSDRFLFFFKSSEIQLESFSPQVQGHCFIHFAFSVLNIWLSNENIPSSWIAFSILFWRSIFNPQMEMTDELWKVNVRSYIWPFPNAQKYFIACISTKCLIWKCFLF